jgi:hypothetical protein
LVLEKEVPGNLLSERVYSIDLFRALTVMVMVFVNDLVSFAVHPLLYALNIQGINDNLNVGIVGIARTVLYTVVLCWLVNTLALRWRISVRL